jgi:hypothetical protein
MNQAQTIKFLKIGIPIFFGLCIFFGIHDYIKQKSYEFNGVVQVVTYDVKGAPDVKINGSEYFLTYHKWGFDHKIQVGDSLIKAKNTLVIKLVKQKNMKIIFFK